MEYRDRHKQYEREAVNRFIKSGLVSQKTSYNDGFLRRANMCRKMMNEAKECDQVFMHVSNTNVDGFTGVLNDHLKIMTATNTVD